MLWIWHLWSGSGSILQYFWSCSTRQLYLHTVSLLLMLLLSYRYQFSLPLLLAYVTCFHNISSLFSQCCQFLIYLFGSWDVDCRLMKNGMEDCFTRRTIKVKHFILISRSNSLTNTKRRSQCDTDAKNFRNRRRYKAAPLWEIKKRGTIMSYW